METFDYPMELRDYWAMAMRRKLQFLIPFLVIVGGAAALAFLLPSTYRSEATFLIQRQTIPQNLVQTTVNSYVQEQIQQIRQRLVAYDNLVDLAEKFDLYPQQLASDPRSVVQEMRDSIEVDMVDITASDPDQAGQRRATIAFTVAFAAETLEMAQAVTRELAERYRQIHQAAREERAAEVTDFLSEEARKLAEEIAGYEEQLAQFKQDELRQLPELMDMNLNLYERTEQQIEQTRERIRDLEDRINVTQSELSLTEPYQQVRGEDGQVVLTGSERLSALTAEYLRATARYSAEHPDVIRLSREIKVLAQQTGTSARADELMSELVNLQEQLRQAEQKYSPDHPEVARLERSIAALQSGFRTALVSGDEPDMSENPPDNPRYVALKTQLDAYRSNVTAERQRLGDLEDKLAEYEERLFQTPVVERDYKTLTRDYENARQKYRELRDKQLEAGMAQQLESGESAEKFVLASPAYRPSSPESPNRLGILLLGGLFGVAAGIGMVAVAEYMDNTIRGARMVARVLGAPPLAIIPDMKTVRRRV